jgi:GH15 family glucan-1,4-alpha-glucosidase
MTEISALVSRSVEVIEGGQGPAGGYLASPTFATYHYSWFRDGAFTADAISRTGRTASTERFFDWCSRIISARVARIDILIERAVVDGAASIAREEHLHTRYRLDGTESSGFWENFQLDGYGTWLWGLAQHTERHGTDPARWMPAVEATVRYLRTFWDQPSYDWWEEHPEQVHTSTLGCIWAGLEGAARLGVADDGTIDRVRRLLEHEGVGNGHLVKWLGADAVDASTLALIEPLRVIPAGSAVGRATIEAVENELADGGVHRFAADTFYGGGSWVLLAGFLGLCHLALGNRARVDELIGWMAAQADAEGHLPEQVPPLLYPDRKPEWVERWGPPARPLLWSHAMFITLAVEAGVGAGVR